MTQSTTPIISEIVSDLIKTVNTNIDDANKAITTYNTTCDEKDRLILVSSISLEKKVLTEDDNKKIKQEKRKKFIKKAAPFVSAGVIVGAGLTVLGFFVGKKYCSKKKSSVTVT